jgi:hypothetical protein
MDMLSKLEGGEIIAAISVLGGLLIAITAIIAAHWRGVRHAEMETNLKQQMLARGMSAAEIEQVLKASSTSGKYQDPPIFTGNVGTDKATLVKLMSDNGMDGQDIARVLQAFDTPERRPESPEWVQVMRQKAELVGNLLHQAMDCKDIEKVLHAFQTDHIKSADRPGKA